MTIGRVPSRPPPAPRTGAPAATTTPAPTTSTTPAPSAPTTTATPPGPSTAAPPTDTTGAEARSRATHDVGASVRASTLASSGTVGSGGLGTGHTAAASTHVERAAWERNPAGVLSELTQRPGGGATALGGAHADDRCGPSSLLGASIMNGPAATERTLRSVAGSSSSTLSSADRTSLRTIADHVRDDTATVGELSEAQALMYRAGNTRTSITGPEMASTATTFRSVSTSTAITAAERSHMAGYARRLEGSDSRFTPTEATEINSVMERAGRPGGYVAEGGVLAQRHGYSGSSDASAFSDAELEGLARRTGTPTSTRPLGVSEELSGLLRRGSGLDSGESATVRVHGGGDIERGTAAGSMSDHFITVGRDANGHAYIYNPDPSAEDRTLVTGSDAEVRRALARYDDRIVMSGNDAMPDSERMPQLTIMHGGD